MRLILPLLIIVLFIALGVPSFARGHWQTGAVISVACVLLLALAFGSYGPFRDRFHARWQSLKSAMVPYVIAAAFAIAAGGALEDALSSIRDQRCQVPDGPSRGRSLFLFACNWFGYRTYAALNLAVISLFGWAGVKIWRITRRGSA